jgi:hypothetical protein
MHRAIATSPVLDHRLRTPVAHNDLAARWRERPALRIADALESGLAAELAMWATRLPLGVMADWERRSLWWTCDVQVPPRPDPQWPECVLRVARFLDDELPGLAGAITGRELTAATPRRFSVRMWRKGSFADGPPLVPDGSIEAVVGLTAATWPESWGGCQEYVNDQGEVIERRPPGWNTLDLADGMQPHRTTLVTRHVAVVTVHTVLEEAG